MPPTLPGIYPAAYSLKQTPEKRGLKSGGLALSPSSVTLESITLGSFLNLPKPVSLSVKEDHSTYLMGVSERLKSLCKKCVAGLSRLLKVKAAERDLCPCPDGQLRAPAVPSMIQHIILKHLLCARLCAKLQGYRSQQNSTVSALMGFTL